MTLVDVKSAVTAGLKGAAKGVDALVGAISKSSDDAVKAADKASDASKAAGKVDTAANKAESLTAEQTKNLERCEDKLPSGAGDTAIHDLPNGGKAFQADVPGKVPDSKAIYEKQVDATGKTVQYTKTTVDPQGNIVDVKDKLTVSTVKGPCKP